MPEDSLSVSIPPILLNRFDEAAALANSGNSAAALEKYQSLFTGEDGQKIQGAVTGEFLATVELRKAYCLMDLGQYQDAKAVFEELDKFLAGQLDMDGLYQFYFSYGNTLGNLGLLTDMEDRMGRAMNIATAELQDTDKFRDIWRWVLHWEKHHQTWEALDEHCISANEFGIQNSDLQLQIIALEFRCYAHRALGRLEQARKGAEGIVLWKQRNQDDPESIQEWQRFLGSLDDRSGESD